MVLDAALLDLDLRDLLPYILAEWLQWLLSSGLLVRGWEGSWYTLCM